MDGGVTGTPGERLAQEQVLQRDVIAPFWRDWAHTAIAIWANG